MDSVFDELDYRLSLVPRWVVLGTIQKQSVAEHCFNVERIARKIAVVWFDLQDPKELNLLSQVALHHDDEEAITGDIPGPAKKGIFNETYLDALSAAWYNVDGQTRRIVKLADLMEAFWFLSMEVAMGNKYVERHRMSTADQMFEYARQFGPEIMHRLNGWVSTTKDMKSGRYG
jgi:5'-deoxynucleotidase YfbR-like HD superfamily hydrolase